MSSPVPERIRMLALSRPGDVRRKNPGEIVERLRELGVDPDSQLAAFFREFSTSNMLSASSPETLVDPPRPTRFIHEVWKLPQEYVCITSCEGEGCYLYSTRTGAVYDFGLATRAAFLADPVARWKDFDTFIEWYLWPGLEAFRHPVGQAETFGNVAVVRLDVPPGTRLNENVFAISSDGRVLWQIAPESHAYEDSPYTGLSRDGDQVVAHNWDGAVLWLDPASGQVIRRGYRK